MSIAEFNIETGEVTTRDPTPEEIAQYAVQKKESNKYVAQIHLDNSDTVALRCFKAGVTFPADWQAWSTHCRNVIRGTVDLDETLKPSQYPTGT